jgi:rhodanese-related sulfurtransferase
VLRDDGAVIVDVREPDDGQPGTSGAITESARRAGLPGGRAAPRPLDRGRLPVGNRSARDCDILPRRRFVAVTSLDGGMTDWAAAGMPMETGS